MSFPKDFLISLTTEKELTSNETEVFLALFGGGKSRVQITHELPISESALGTRLTGIYKKFHITGNGPVKESRLKDYLTHRYQRRQTAESSVSNDSEQSIDALVQEVRERVQPYIQEKCGTMRVLDMSQPIELGNIYTSVNILEKLTRTRGLDLVALMQDTDPDQFDRFCLGDVRERRVPGLKAVEKFSKLMILGKPGAGKTTFLKHLAIQCIGGTFQSDRVPVFVTLKDFAEAPKQPDLLEYIDRVVPMPCDPSPTPPRHGEGLSDSPFPTREGGWGVRSFVPIQEILKAGRALILLDGLDEVRDADSSRVLRQIREFSQQFSQNQFVITCRIAAREYTFEKFTEVEIADFDDEQIADFSGKWFHSKNDPIKAERFLQKLTEDAPIRELATNPLLLTLLCLVFEDSGSFPTNRARLYEQGVEKLLRKWNPHERERDPIYKKLSPDYREELLSQIAWKTLKRGNYFFNQREVGKQVREYIQSLPGIPPEDLLRLDSKGVLESIQAQHGLLVERAQGIYSFSHLTFHEYFTAHKIVTSCNPDSADDRTLQELVSHITDKRWREVFLLTIGMLDSADILLKLIKAWIDELLAGDEKLQQFLNWVDDKARSVQSSKSLVSIRCFYLNLFYSLELDSRLVFPPPFLDFPSLKSDSSHVEPKQIYLSFDDVALDYWLERVLECIMFHKNDLGCYDEVAWCLCDAFKCNPNSELQKALSRLLKMLPLSNDKDTHNKICEFISSESGGWIQDLREAMIEYRNIGHNWHFKEEQKQRLQQYYDANKLLVDCLNSECYVSREVRQEIEETLLLSIAEIQKRQQRG